MYAVEQSVRELCVNVRTGATLAAMTAHSGLIDAQLDATLAAKFWWPESSTGQDLSATPPPIITSIASYMVAARIESTAFAQNEAGLNQPNPYGSSLLKAAEKILKQITDGTLVVDGLEARKRTKVTSPPRSFTPSRGLARRR